MLREITRAECIDRLSKGQEVLFVDRENGRFVDLNEVINGLMIADIETKKQEPKEQPKPKKEVKPPVDWGKVGALRKAGWTAPKIADEVGIGVQMIYKHFKANGDPKYPNEAPLGKEKR